MTGLSSSCGACKFLRRKCISECVFAPYFCYDEAATHFAAVHKVFGASNVSKLLLHLPVHSRSDAAITISYEALARIRDPVYGCVAHIFALQQQVASLQEEIEVLGSQMANLGTGLATCGSTEITAFVPETAEMQFSSGQNMNHTQYYENQSPSAALLYHSEYTTANQSFDWSQMNEQLPLNEWEEQNLFCDFHPNSLDKLLEEVDRDVLACCPFLDSRNRPEVGAFQSLCN